MATVKIATGEGVCGCGCGAETKPKRQYKQGHDARLRGILGRAYKAGESVQFGSGKAQSAESALKEHGFPIPPASKPKAAKPKAPAKSTAPKARKRTAAKKAS
jgi:hypothetical protein